MVSRSIYNLKIDTICPICMCDIPFNRQILQLSNGIRHVMPSTDRKLELTAKASMAQPVSQPAVCSNGLSMQNKVPYHCNNTQAILQPFTIYWLQDGTSITLKTYQLLCILYNQRHATYTMFFIIINAQNVSGGPSGAYKTVCLLNSHNPSTPAGDSRKAWQYPGPHIQFYRLLMMGGRTTRNM
jgi:hypothetical protein